MDLFVCFTWINMSADAMKLYYYTLPVGFCFTCVILRVLRLNNYDWDVKLVHDESQFLKDYQQTDQ